MKKLIVSILILMSLSVGSVYAVGHDFDFGGETVVIAESVDLEEIFSEGENLAHLQQIKRDFNVEIEFIHANWAQIRDQLGPAIMAGDVFADVFGFAHRNLWPQVTQGYLLPLNEALEEIDYYNRLPEYARTYLRESANWNGHLFGFGIHLGRPFGLLWNKSLFEREGLPNLYELYNDGDWTWDAFRDIVENVTRDTTGDGEIDLWGFTGNDDLNLWLRTNATTGLRFEDNRPVVPMQEEAAMDTALFLHDLISRELIYSRAHRGERRDIFNEGRSAMHIGPPGYYTGIPEDSQDEFGYVPMPKGPAADRHVAPDGGYIRQLRIPINTEHDPAALIELTSALLQHIEPYTDIQADYDELVNNFAMGAQDFESIESYEYMLHNMEMDFFHINSITSNVRAAWAGEISVAAGIEQGLQADQARMDDAFDAIEEVYGIAE